MKLKLTKYWTEQLLKYPETGMGYQRVDIVLKTGKVIKDIVVLNAEDLLLPDPYENLRVEEIKDLVIINKKR